MIEAPPIREIEVQKQLVHRIVASSHLSKSARLTELFLYLCTSVLDDGVQEIHELELGHKVFGRPVQYDTTADNIVRVHASLLRKRLSEYYLSEGREEELIVEIPRGNYAPVFRRRDLRDPVIGALTNRHASSRETDAEGDAEAAASLVDRPRRQLKFWQLWMPTGLAAAFALLSIFLFVRLHTVTGAPNAAAPAAGGTTRQFWSSIFHPNGNIDVVMDDASVEFYQEAVGHPIALTEYFDRSYLQTIDAGARNAHLDPVLMRNFILRRQSSYADTSTLWKLAQTADSLHSNASLQFARDFSFRQAKSADLILLGNPESNPWIQLFENTLSLRWKFDPDARNFYPIDITTPAGQESYHPAGKSAKTREAYATISFLPNLSSSGNVLIISGTGGAAIDAAMDWLTDEPSMKHLKSQLPGKGSAGFPYFETLLKIEKGTGLPRVVTLEITRELKSPQAVTSRAAQSN